MFTPVNIAKSLSLLVAVWLIGFALFFAAIPRGENAAPAERTDGIVVLTGTGDRITQGLKALEAGSGKRILITGVHPDVAKTTLARELGGAPDLYACCVDIGRQAQNTRGNATEASEWASGHGFRSLTVVTSGYHMPRSLLEFRAAMPGMVLVPLAVDRMPGLPELTGEYVKYALSRIRTLVTSTVSTDS